MAVTDRHRWLALGLLLLALGTAYLLLVYPVSPKSQQGLTDRLT